MDVIAQFLEKFAEYIAEAVHADGDEYFSDMTLKELATDFELYVKHGSTGLTRGK